MKRFIKAKWKEILIIGLLVSVSALAHGYNMLHFPYFENDEGSYSSYGWALLTKGELSPYTYWYDHAPAGWMLIDLWTVLTGGFFTFGFSLNSGRIFMLVLHLLSSIMLYYVGKRITGSKWVGLLSVMLFSLSPLGVYYQRRILLDNIMVFWVLLSILLTLYSKRRLRNIMLSGLVFGISILSKENAVFFIPPLLYLIYTQVHTKQRFFALVTWFILAMSVVSLYFVYALFNGELFPAGTQLGGNAEHVSLIETLIYQAQRDGGSIFDIQNGDFWHNMRVWIEDDPFIMYAGIAATLLNLLIGVRVYAARIVGLLSLSMWLFLLRGGVILELYILPLIPFMALNVALLSWYVHSGLRKLGNNIFIKGFSYTPYLVSLILIISASLYFSTNVKGNLNLYTSDQTTPQMEAINWILSHNRPKAIYVIDNYPMIDLWVKNKGNFARADWYWKIDKDKDVRDEVLGGKPNDIDYLAITPQMYRDIPAAGLTINQQALQNAKPIQRFWNDGWGVEFWATRYPERILESSWDSYKKNFIKDGRVVDPYQNDTTTAESQAYTLLRAVWIEDQQTYDSVYAWTKKNLQQKNGVFSWKWNKQKPEEVNSAEADQDIALSLLFAYKRWGNEHYLKDAQRIIASTWNENVVVIKNTPYITAGKWADQQNSLVINPSYFSPATYRIFSSVDSTHPWQKVADNSYAVLRLCTESNLDKKKGVMPPDWCVINKRTQKAVASTKPNPIGSQYGYNASRVPWRVALDYLWFKSPAAKQYLSELSHLGKEWEKDKKIDAAYEHDGSDWETYESVAAYGGNIGYFKVLSETDAQQLYKTKILEKFYEDKDRSYWDDPKNTLVQNWGWFGTALYADKLPNLWNEHHVQTISRVTK